MFTNPFNKAAKPEERVPPRADYAKPLINSKVFQVEKHQRDLVNAAHNRIYYGATPNSTDEETWDLYSYQYSAGQKSAVSYSLDTYTSGGIYTYRGLSLMEAVSEISRLEKAALNLGCAPVPGLEGNFRDFAVKCDAYIDDKGNFISIKGNVPVKSGVTLRHEQLSELYKEQTAAKITTWKDFYKEIVRRKPPSPEVMIDGVSEWAVFLEDKIKKISDGGISWSEKKGVLAEMSSTWGVENAYHYNVFLLTKLMRAGTEVFDKFTVSGGTDQMKAVELERIGNTISAFAQNRLGLPEERANQLKSVIMDGPDPYAGQPLPFEKLMAKAAAAKKPKATHSP